MALKDKKTTNKPRQKTVLLAMDDSIGAAVAAYLLKKQGLNCIAVSFVFLGEKSPECLAPLIIKDLLAVKKICKSLELTHYAVDAKDAFKDQVLDNMVASKLSARNFDPAMSMNKIIFELLLSKMPVLKADYISSGHFARVVHNQQKKTFSIGVANDIAYDESARLCMVATNCLEKMILPLSDLQYIGVLKIADLINYKFGDILEKKKQRREILNHKDFSKVVLANSSASFCKKGEVKMYGNEAALGEHFGSYLYHLEQKKIPIKGENQLDAKLEIISMNPHRKEILVLPPGAMKYTHSHLQGLKITPGLDISCPLKVYLLLLGHEEKSSCTLYLKNNGTALVDYEQEYEGQLPAGTHLVFYDKKGDRGKVFAHGVVENSGFFLDGRFRTLPETKLEKELLPSNKPAPINTNLKF